MSVEDNANSVSSILMRMEDELRLRRLEERQTQRHSGPLPVFVPSPVLVPPSRHEVRWRYPNYVGTCSYEGHTCNVYANVVPTKLARDIVLYLEPISGDHYYFSTLEVALRNSELKDLKSTVLPKWYSDEWAARHTPYSVPEPTGDWS